MPIFIGKSAEDMESAYQQCIKVARFRIKWKDIFNVKEFYRALHEWFLEYEWTDAEDKMDHYETLYFEKIGLFNDKELWLRWRLQKIQRGNAYFKYHLDLDFHFLYLVPTEVIREGKKFKKDVYKGEVEVWITALIEPDYKNQWSHHPVLKYFTAIMPYRIMRRDLFEEHRRIIYREAYILQNFIKHWFKLKRFLPYEEIEQFFPSQAYPTYTKEGE